MGMKRGGATLRGVKPESSPAQFVWHGWRIWEYNKQEETLVKWAEVDFYEDDDYSEQDVFGELRKGPQANWKWTSQ